MCRIFGVLSLIVLLTALPFSSSYAAAGAGEAKGDATEAQNADDKLLHYRYAEATNPRCGASKTVTRNAAIAIGPAIGTGMVGAAILKIPSKFTTPIGLAMIASSVAVIAGAVGASSAYFVCNWSFVRHPVLRFDSYDSADASAIASSASSSDSKAGKYKECAEPITTSNEVKKQWEGNDCSKEFIDLNSYFACIAKDKSIDEAKMLEPVCKQRKFKDTDKYAWPKNRVSSSRYIEVCYRLPLGTLFKAAYRALKYSVRKESYTEILRGGAYPRESMYGDATMHRTKLTISGAGDDQPGDNNGYVKCATLKAGQQETLHDAQFRAVERGSQICVDAISVSNLPLIPRPEIGCHMRPDSPPVPMCDKSKPKYKEGATTGDASQIVGYDNSGCYSCYIHEACQGAAASNTLSPFPVTSVLVNCIVGSLRNILSPPDPTKCPNQAAVRNVGTNPGFLKVAQEKLKKAVMATLVLALILFAIKAALGGVQNASELYMTAIKFALVVFFTQSNAMATAYDYLINLSVGISDIVLQAGGSTNVCDYKIDDYKNPGGLAQHGGGLTYLLPWDRLDCRMMFYMGSQLNGGTGVGVMLTVLLCAALLIPAILINAKVIICVVAFFAVLMLIFTVIWAVYVFLLSLIALTILTIISPLMIPMCLFQVTKGFFDGWTKQLMVYSLYPVILFAFLSLMFTVFDQLYFGNLEFVRDKYDVYSLDGKAKREKIGFKLKDPGACDKPGMEDNLACMFSTVQFHSKPLVLGLSVTSPEFKNTTAKIWTKLGVFALVGFLFYHFLSSIAYIAGELAGDPRAGVIGSGSLNPMASTAKVMGAASAVSSKASGAMGDLGSRVKQGLRGGGSGDSGGTDAASGGSTPRGGVGDSGGGGTGGGAGGGTGGGTG
ncbi:MAG: type IV secretion system protein [Anaplasma sp.]